MTLVVDDALVIPDERDALRIVGELMLVNDSDVPLVLRNWVDLT